MDDCVLCICEYEILNTEKSAVIPPVFCAVTVSIPDPASALKSSIIDSTIRPGLL